MSPNPATVRSYRRAPLRDGAGGRHSRRRRAVVRALALGAAAAGIVACAGGPGGAGEAEPAPDPPPEPRVVQPGAPGEASRPVEGRRGAARERPRYTEADVAFMQAMIVHHAQALTMAALVPDRTDRREIRLLAGRIAASQESEIALMRRWLESRGEDVVDSATRDHAGHREEAMPGMAGMATPEELARLEAAAGPAFDRLFLELMIRHHEGALEMVRALYEAGGLDPEVYMFAGHVDADQRAEITRMRRLQEVLFP